MPGFKPSLISLLKPVLFTALAFMHTAIVFAQIPKDAAKLKKMLAASAADESRADLLLDLGTEYLNKPGELKSDMDSALLLKQQAFLLSNKLKYGKGIGRSLLLEGQIYHEKGDNKRSWILLRKAIDYGSSHNLNEQIGEAYQAMGVHFSNEGTDLDRRILYNQKAADYFEKASLKIRLAQTYETLGDLYQLKREYDTAILLLQRSLKIYNAIGFKRTQGVCNILGFTYYFKGDYYNALKYLLLAVKRAEQLGDISQLATIYNRLGSVYSVLLQPEKAFAVWKTGLDVAEKNNDINATNEIKLRLINLLRKEKKYNQALVMLKNLDTSDPDVIFQTTFQYEFANIYLNLKQYNQVKIYINSLKNLTRKFPKESRTWAYFYMVSIKYYFESHQFKESDLPSVGNDAIKKMSFSIYNLAEYQLYWSKIDSALGNDASALQHYKIYTALHDSIVSSRNSKQLSELQLQYDSENKDQNIRLLTQQSQLQQTRINNQEIIRNVIIVGLIVVLIFSGLIYSRYLLNKRVNERLAIKQSKINGQNKILQKLVEEKEWLLKEIHHRVKNNLQIVISLLNSQSAFLENKDALAAIQSSQHRMHAMSLIHQKLYQSGNMASIDMHWYIQELVNYIKESFHSDKKISFILNIDQIELDVAQAVPLGLILNEAITNAIKYAFPESQKGKVSISFKLNNEDTCLLTIADNGTGLPTGFNLKTNESLGMSLMHGLSEQLDGNLLVNSDKGLMLSLTFKRNQHIVID
jgi:two-component sensor histidine kinase